MNSIISVLFKNFVNICVIYTVQKTHGCHVHIETKIVRIYIGMRSHCPQIQKETFQLHNNIKE